MELKKLGIIGCGKMATAIIEGVIASNYIDNKNVYVFDINSDSSKKISNKLGLNQASTIEEVTNNSDCILIATKPFVVSDVLSELKKFYKNQLVISILAGVKTDKYLSFINNIKLVRIMPNTPALVNMGMSAICKSENVSDVEFDFVYNFMEKCGSVIKTTEDKMDIITALSGSGPAYYYKIIELMASAAHKLGLDYNQALLLSAQTAMGSAKMVFENNFDIPLLIKNVTTPGGCTEVGNNVLNNSDIDEIIDKIIKDTMDKAVALG